MSIKFKMTLWYTLLMLAIVGVVTIFIMTTSNASAEMAAKNILQNIVEQNERELWYVNGDLRQYGFYTYQDGVYMMVYDMTGQLVLGTEPVELPEVSFEPNSFGTFEVNGGVFYYYQVFVISAESGGSFQATGKLTGTRVVRSDSDGETSVVASGEINESADSAAPSDEPESEMPDTNGETNENPENGIPDSNGEMDGNVDGGSGEASGEIVGEVGGASGEISAGNAFPMGDMPTEISAYEGASYTVQLLSAESSSDAVVYLSSVTASGTASGEPWADGVWLMGILSADTVTTVGPLTFVALLLLVLLAALGGWIMAKKALDPVQKIEASAREISGGEDLSRRIDLGKGQDEIHKLAGTINGMLDRLETSFTAERQFTSDASHELRTPTAVILAECELAEKTATEPEEFLQCLSVIERQGRKMSALIGTLLAYTRREQGLEKLQLERFDLSELTEAICQEQAMVNRDDITLVTNLQPKVFVLADSGLIMSLIQNLITNAYKYGRSGGHVWVTLSTYEGSIFLSVRDDGVGISKADQVKVWNRFYQVDLSRSNQDGSLGLGLSLVRQIARLHGGRVSLSSEEGKGSEFVFSMPVDMGGLTK